MNFIFPISGSVLNPNCSGPSFPSSTCIRSTSLFCLPPGLHIRSTASPCLPFFTSMASLQQSPASRRSSSHHRTFPTLSRSPSRLISSHYHASPPPYLFSSSSSLKGFFKVLNVLELFNPYKIDYIACERAINLTFKWKKNCTLKILINIRSFLQRKEKKTIKLNELNINLPTS